jgi:hypothetical protein
MGRGVISETRYVYVRLRDVAGNVSSTGSASIKVDFDNPVLTSIVINSGNPATTTSTNVNIYFTASDVSPGSIRYMMVSEDPAFAGSTWLIYTNPYSFILSSTNGTKTVYAKVKDGAGRESITRNDSIILDNVKPTPIAIDIYDSTCTNKIEYTNNTSVCLRVMAEDNVAYGANLLAAFSNSSTVNCSTATYSYNFAGCTESHCPKYFTWTLTGTSGDNYVSVCVKDQAGNVSAYSINSSVYFDNTAPTAPANITVTPKSHSAIVAWTASTDMGGSGIKKYVVEYSTKSDFSTYNSVEVDGNTTNADIQGLENGRIYNFRVKAVDYANNESGYIAKYNVLIGFTRANINVPEFITEKIYSPNLSYIYLEEELNLLYPHIQ